MAKRELKRMTIEPAENGGHTIEHQWKESRHPGRPGSLEMVYHEPESHVFGPSEGGKMMEHIGKHLGVKAEVKPKHEANAAAEEEDNGAE